MALQGHRCSGKIRDGDKENFYSNTSPLVVINSCLLGLSLRESLMNYGESILKSLGLSTKIHLEVALRVQKSLFFLVPNSWYPTHSAMLKKPGNFAP
jgi:hypothetical protein